MGLPLTRRIDEDRIHVRVDVGRAVLCEHPHAALHPPFTDQLTPQTITLHHTNAPRGLASA